MFQLRGQELAKEQGYINPKVYDLYWDGEVPGYLRKVTKTEIVMGVDTWRGAEEYTFTIEDIAEYYAHEANNIISGCRTLGDLTSDWRPVDNIARECLEIFKHINVEKMKRAARKLGLEPKF